MKQLSQPPTMREATHSRAKASSFGAKNPADLKNADRERYMRRRLEAAQINYRTNAVLGLGVIGAETPCRC